MTHAVYIVALIKHNKKVLILHRANMQQSQLPWFEFTGGKSPEEALRRALENQLKSSITVLQLHDVYAQKVNQQSVLIIVFNTALSSPESLAVDPKEFIYEWVSMINIHQHKLDELSRLVLGVNTELIPKSTRNTVDSMTTSNVVKSAIIHTDGGSRGNPGPSAAGYVISNEFNEIIFEGGEYLGITTNNQAEYQAVRLALEKAKSLGIQTIKLKMDSLLVVNQLSGLYQIKNRDLWPIHAHIKRLIARFEEVTFEHVRREFNQEADHLVNKVLDEKV